MVKRHRQRDREWDLFLSYAHADRAVAERLYGLLSPRTSVFLDKVSIEAGDDWPEVIDDAISHAMVIAVIVTPATDRAYFQKEEVLRALDQARTRGARVVPVLIGKVPSSLPFGLSRKQAILAKDAAGAAQLLWRAVESESQSEERRFSPSVREHFAELHRAVDRLTAEQFRVLSHLQYARRVRISGNAGSGKTLVAVEKASRMARGGQRVLFLCHNPLLARHVAQLTAGTGVVVIDFGSWIGQTLGDSSTGAAPWHVYEEPDQETLDRAAQILGQANVAWDSVIVDEAQDFRDAWWDVVKAALKSDGVFYLFHDNNQSLLPHRGDYPAVEVHINLSRNCRNAGRIFELMRCFDGGLPETEEELGAKGHLRLTLYEPGEEAPNLAKVLAEIESQLHLKPVILWSGPEPMRDSPILGLEMRIADDSWQEHLRKAFHRLLFKSSFEGIVPPHIGAARVEATLKTLSRFLYPTNDDIAAICRLAGSFEIAEDVETGGRRKPPAGREPRRREPAARQLLASLQNGKWVDDLPHSTLQTAAFDDPFGIFRVRVFGVPDFKGLEAEAVILVMRGRATSHRQATYVGISRARALLWILADRSAAAALPPDFSWDKSWPVP